MIAYSSKEVRAAVGYRGRNEVDKAAAWWSGLRPLFPTCVDVVLRGQQIAAQLSAVIGHPKLTG